MSFARSLLRPALRATVRAPPPTTTPRRPCPPCADSPRPSAQPLAARPLPLAVRSIHLAADSATVSQDVPEHHQEPFEVQLSDQSFHEWKLDAHGGGPGTALHTTKEELVNMYDTMVQMRRMEMAADALYKQKYIRGFCHLAIGQEAVATGMHFGMTPEDLLITSYRCHPFAALRGGSIYKVMAELFGRDGGISQGKGGSMHMFTKTFFGGNGIVGAQVPVGAGLAFTQKYLGTNNATFTMYGDGASNQGQVFEAFNMAQLWQLPCVFICENNKYGMGTSAERSSMNTKFYERGDVIPGLQVNAMDVLAVRQATQWAREYTTSGKGPLVMEFTTYRYGGHSLSDPGTTYRTREEIQRMRTSADPIQGLKSKLLEWGIKTEDEIKAIDKQAKADVDEAVEQAKKSPEPPMSKLWTDIYIPGSEPPVLRGRVSTESHSYSA